LTGDSDIQGAEGRGALSPGAEQAEASGPAAMRAALGSRVVALVGMMGSGKTSIGKRLANKLGLPFIDSDGEIELAAGMTITEIFDRHGEPYFRDGERRVIARLLNEGSCVLATGGGAFMDPRTREALSRTAVTIWLRADLTTLIQRIARRNNRPLMRTADPAAQVERLLTLRVPTYSLADITVDSSDRPHDEVVATLMNALSAHLQVKARPRVAL